MDTCRLNGASAFREDLLSKVSEKPVPVWPTYPRVLAGRIPHNNFYFFCIKNLGPLRLNRLELARSGVVKLGQEGPDPQVLTIESRDPRLRTHRGFDSLTVHDADYKEVMSERTA